jgi:pimeloyl-ACP methyl ester carboxylesterase
MVKRMKFSLVASSIALMLLSGCGSIDNDGKNVVGADKLLSVTPLFDIPSSQMQPTVTAMAPGKPAFGMKGYRVVYSTKNERGEDIKVSGLITVPVPSELILNGLKAKGKNYSMSIVSNQHGTIFPDYEAPTSSVIATKKPTTIGTMFSAIGGFVTVEPDYIGFGESKTELHPYLLEKSSASTVVDMIEAAIKFGNDNQLPLNGQIFLTGYSEGGYVTLAAAKEIEKNHPDMTLKAIAPMSGPYDLNLTGMGVLSETNMTRPDFIAGIVYSYATDLDLELENIVNTAYASKLPDLFNAEHNSTQIQAELTTNIADFFVPAYRGDFLTNPNNTLRTAFVDNSVDDWKPTTPTKLLYCSGDTTIPFSISQNAAKKMEVDAIDLNSSLGHTDCALPAYGYALKWFDELRSK